MRRLIILMISICILSSCGISNSDTEYMQQVLNNRLGDYYANEKVSIMFINAELKKIEKNPNYLGGVYSGTFGCSFETNNKKIYITGAVAYDKELQIIVMPEYYGKNKVGIDISNILVNGQPISKKEINKSPFVLNCFMNRNKLSGNE